MKTKVLITGGTKGIGLATVKLFVKNNFEVYAVGRDFSMSTFPKNYHPVIFDLSHIEAISELYKKIGDIEILINNAGIMNTLPYDHYPSSKKNLILRINLEAPLELIKVFSQGMIQQGHGRIVNTASIAGHIGHPDIWYGITKAGIINVTKSFAQILGPKGIIINAVAPGPTDTDMLHTKIPKERIKNLKKASVLGRIAKPEEIAQTIYWLATKSPNYINGICLDINNGAYMR